MDLAREPGVRLRPNVINLTDDELLARRLEIEDPDELAALSDWSDTLPDEDVDWHIDTYYALDTRRFHDTPLQRCAKCRRRNHYKGVVLLFEDGFRRLIGWSCAEKHFRADFRTAKKQYDDTILRRRAARQVRGAADAFPALLEEILDVRKSKEVKSAIAVQHALERDMPSLWKELQKYAGRLIIERRVRDDKKERDRESKLEAEMAARAFKLWNTRHLDDLEPEQLDELYRDVVATDPKLERTPIYRTEERVWASIDGSAFLKAIGYRYDQDISVLRDLWHRSEEPTDHSETAALRKIVKGALKAAESVEETMTRVRAAGAFFADGNLRRIADWANHVQLQGGPYSASDGQLVAGDSAAISLPSGWEAPPTPRLNDFRRFLLT